MKAARGLPRGLLALVIVSAVALTPATAWAHAALVSMSPANGAVLASPPTQVVLTFDENIQDIGDVVIVTGPNGGRFDTGAPAILDRTATQALKPLPYQGHYSVSYRVVSADGHPVTNTLGFTVTTGPTAPPVSVQPPSGSAEPGDSGAGGATMLAAPLLAAALATAWWLRRRGRPARELES